MSFTETFSPIGWALVRWAKRHTTVDALKDGLKTSVWVVPLTLLVWIYAEQKQRTPEEKGQTVLISIRSADPNRVVTLLRPHDDLPIISMSGPRQAVDDVKNLLAGDKPL